MKTILLLLLLPIYTFGQYPVDNHFNESTLGNWTQVLGPTGDAGWDGATDLSFNIASNYTDNEYYSFESEILDHTGCDSIKVDFSVNYAIRNGGDDFLFCYKDGTWGCISIPNPGLWTVDLPNTTTQVSFDLDSRGNGNLNGKYATVDYTNISQCYVTILPITLLKFECAEELTWSTASEIDLDYYIIDFSKDANTWEEVLRINSKGSHSTYKNRFDKSGYYRLRSIDLSGEETMYDITYCDKEYEELKIIRIYDVMGKELKVEMPGLNILLYNNNTTKKLFRYER